MRGDFSVLGIFGKLLLDKNSCCLFRFIPLVCGGGGGGGGGGGASPISESPSFCPEGPARCQAGAEFIRDLYADDYEQCLFLCAAAEEEGCGFFTFFGAANSCWMYRGCDQVEECQVGGIFFLFIPPSHHTWPTQWREGGKGGSPPPQHPFLSNV